MSKNANKAQLVVRHVVSTKPAGAVNKHQKAPAADPNRPWQSAHGHDKVLSFQGGTAAKSERLGFELECAQTEEIKSAFDWAGGK